MEKVFQKLTEEANLFGLGINATKAVHMYMEMKEKVTENSKYVNFKVCGEEYRFESVK